MGAKKLNSSRHVAMATDKKNANGPSNHHIKFESFLVIYS